jgi:cysteine desulfurase
VAREVYLDNNATTPVSEAVVAAVVSALRDDWGNPSSTHGPGETAAALVETARARVARLLGARSPEEVVFTSGGTESINTALFATLGGGQPRGTVLTGAAEHAAVLRPLEHHAARGLAVERVAVDPEGRVDLDALHGRLEELGPECRLVTVQWANNETGALLTEDALAELAAHCRSEGVPLHVDAVQIPGKLPMRVAELGLDLVSISAHKFHGPKGAGALFVRRGSLERAEVPGPLVAGGSQELDRRGGTQNVPGIVGMGVAADLAREHAADPAARAAVRELRDHLESGLRGAIPGVRIHAAGGPRLDNTTSAHLPGPDGELLLQALAAAGLAVSGGAACSARRRGPSPVLLAMGLPAEEASRTVRFSLSRGTTREDVEEALGRLQEVRADLEVLGTG